MSATQRHAFKELKSTLMTEINTGTITAANAAVLVLRLQQITCGHGFNENPRLEALEDILLQRPGKTVIWARFVEDIRQIKNLLGDKAVTYFGDTSPEDRIKAVASFLDKDSGIDYFVSNQSCGGTGLNLQGECRTAIYYSNSFNSIDRWQSEDRIHRIGTTKTVTYFDLICTGSPDRKILANLRAKKNLSNMVLSDIKEMFS
jgi:SNF2 family DNA or RNA helicase